MGSVPIQLIRIIGVLLNMVHIEARGPRHDKELLKYFNMIKRYNNHKSPENNLLFHCFLKNKFCNILVKFRKYWFKRGFAKTNKLANYVRNIKEFSLYSTKYV